VRYGRYLRPEKSDEIIVIEYIQPPKEFSKPVKALQERTSRLTLKDIAERELETNSLKLLEGLMKF